MLIKGKLWSKALFRGTLGPFQIPGAGPSYRLPAPPRAPWPSIDLVNAPPVVALGEHGSRFRAEPFTSSVLLQRRSPFGGCGAAAGAAGDLG